MEIKFGVDIFEGFIRLVSTVIQKTIYFFSDCTLDCKEEEFGFIELVAVLIPACLIILLIFLAYRYLKTKKTN